MTIEQLFSDLKTKDIVCWGSGKHFRNHTYPLLRSSGLIDNLKCFVDNTGTRDVILEEGRFETIRRKDLVSKLTEKTVILVAVVGYREILTQLRNDPALADCEAIPSIYLEAFYGDILMLSAPKPPAGFRKNDHPVIPKIIHTFWFTDRPDKPIPEKYRKYLDSWKKYAPDMEIKIWDLETYHPQNCTYFDQAVEQKMWAFASDYARADVLRRYGGIYMDLDVEMLRPIDDLLYNDAYMSFESLDRIECGSGMGAGKGNRMLDEICKSYESSPFIKEDGTPDMSTCPVRYTKVIENYGLVKNGGFQFVDDITIYPFEVLTGKSFDTGIIYTTDLSYTLHHHNGSWVPHSAKNAMKERYQEIEEYLKKAAR